MDAPTGQVATSRRPDGIHRTSYLVLGAALFVALVVAAVIAALVGAGNDEQTPTVTTASAAAATRSLAADAAGTVQNTTISVKPAAGWKVLHKTGTEIFLGPPKIAGFEDLFSTKFTGSTDQLAQTLVALVAKAEKNVKVCGKVFSAKLPNGPPGVFIPLCATHIPQNGQAIQEFVIVFAGAASGGAYEVEFDSVADNTVLNKLLNTSLSTTLKTVRWKLYKPQQ